MIPAVSTPETILWTLPVLLHAAPLPPLLCRRLVVAPPSALLIRMLVISPWLQPLLPGVRAGCTSPCLPSRWRAPSVWCTSTAARASR